LSPHLFRRPEPCFLSACSLSCTRCPRADSRLGAARGRGAAGARPGRAGADLSSTGDARPHRRPRDGPADGQADHRPNAGRLHDPEDGSRRRFACSSAVAPGGGAAACEGGGGPCRGPSARQPQGGSPSCRSARCIFLSWSAAAGCTEGREGARCAIDFIRRRLLPQDFVAAFGTTAPPTSRPITDVIAGVVERSRAENDAITSTVLQHVSGLGGVYGTRGMPPAVQGGSTPSSRARAFMPFTRTGAARNAQSGGRLRARCEGRRGRVRRPSSPPGAWGLRVPRARRRPPLDGLVGVRPVRGHERADDGGSRQPYAAIA